MQRRRPLLIPGCAILLLASSMGHVGAASPAPRDGRCGVRGRVPRRGGGSDAGPRRVGRRRSPYAAGARQARRVTVSMKTTRPKTGATHPRTAVPGARWWVTWWRWACRRRRRVASSATWKRWRFGAHPPADHPDLRRASTYAIRHAVRRHQRGRRQDHRLRLRDLLPRAPGRNRLVADHQDEGVGALQRRVVVQPKRLTSWAGG